MSARPVFIVSSGRSGSAMMQRLFEHIPGLSMHHEYMVHYLQPLGVRNYLGLVEAEECDAILKATIGAALHYAQSPVWGDSSNKLSWLIEPLARLWPEARFIHLTRDGRKVAGSYLRKLSNECYGDRDCAILQAHYDDPAANPPPPLEKPFWWPVPRRHDPAASDFRKFNQFERIAWHWSEINRVILDAAKEIQPNRIKMFRLEDLKESEAALHDMCSFLGLSCPDGLFGLLSRPHNVSRPEDQPLSQEEAIAFRRIAWPMMERLGYAARPEYTVDYGPAFRRN